MNGQPEMDGWMDGRMDRRTDRRIDGRTDGQMDGRMDGKMYEQKSPCILQDFIPLGAAALK